MYKNWENKLSEYIKIKVLKEFITPRCQNGQNLSKMTSLYRLKRHSRDIYRLKIKSMP